MPRTSCGVDNTAFAVVNLPRPAKVLVVTPGNDALELALETDEAKKIADVSIAEPKLLETKAYADQAIEGRLRPDHLRPVRPQDDAHLQHALHRPLAAGRLGAPKGRGRARRWSSTPTIVHPLTQLVQMGNVKIVEATPLTGPPGTITLIDSDIGPVYAIGPRAGYEDAVLGFEHRHLHARRQTRGRTPTGRSAAAFRCS